jgi:hypothetical protein
VGGEPLDETVRGIKSVAEVLGCSPATVYELLARPSDPLRLFSADHDRSPWAPRSRLVAFRRRWRSAENLPEADRVSGWVAVAQLVGTSVRLAQTLADREVDPLPVLRTRTGRVFAIREALLDWLDGQNRPHRSRFVAARKRGAGSARERATGDRPGERARSEERTAQTVRQEGGKGPAQKGRRAAA